MLLTAADVGLAFRRARPRPDPDEPGLQPCRAAGHAVAPAPTVPASARGSVRFVALRGGAEVAETVLIYSTVAAARRAEGADVTGLRCASGVVPVGPRELAVNIDGPQRLSVGAEPAGADEVRGWQLTAPGVRITLVVARLSATLVRLAFRAATGTQRSVLPSARVITARAIGRVGGAL